jgi:hypothetical protein
MERLRAIASDGILPPWSTWFGDGAMVELVPDQAMREALEQEMPRLPLAHFEETMPLRDDWTERPCAFLLPTEAYPENAADAGARGGPVAEIPGVQRLASATDPMAVTDTLLDLERTLRGSA